MTAVLRKNIRNIGDGGNSSNRPSGIIAKSLGRGKHLHPAECATSGYRQQHLDSCN